MGGKKKEEVVKTPKTFATKAYLKAEGEGTYRLYRDIVVEVVEGGRLVREKVGKSICISPFPLRELRQDDDERAVVLESFHPVEMRPMRLVEVRD